MVLHVHVQSNTVIIFIIHVCVSIANLVKPSFMTKPLYIIGGCKFMGVVNSWMLLICIIYIPQVNSIGVYLSIICSSINVLFYQKAKCLESK